MTPTLVGRWMTRILLYFLVALPVTYVYSLYLAGFSWPLPSVPALPFHIIDVMFVLGFLFDPIYILIQRTRWDQDWPFIFQFVAMCGEFLLAIWLIDQGALVRMFGPHLLDAWTIGWHFFWVILFSFVALLAVFQILYIRWRFKGGEAGRFKADPV